MELYFSSQTISGELTTKPNPGGVLVGGEKNRNSEDEAFALPIAVKRWAVDSARRILVLDIGKKNQLLVVDVRSSGTKEKASRANYVNFAEDVQAFLDTDYVRSRPQRQKKLTEEEVRQLLQG